MLVPVSQGRTVAGSALASSVLTLDNSGIDQLFVSNTSTRRADYVTIYDPAFTQFYFLNDAWRNQSTFQYVIGQVIPSGSGFDINKRSEGDYLWTIPSDFEF
jgi:hypothetical protein